MEKQHGLRCANVFHAGDGNLHPLILFDANDTDQLHRAEAFGAEILDLQRRHGRHRHRRARRRRREAVVDVRAVLARRARADESRSSAPSIRPACSIPGKVIPTLRPLRRVREDARQARPGRVSRPAAVLSASPDRPVRAGRAPARRQRLAPRRSACAAAAARTSTASRRAATSSTCAASRAVEHEPTELVVTAPRRHERRRARGPARRARPVPRLRAAALRPELDRRRHGRRRPLGAGPGARRVGARSPARRARCSPATAS